MTERAIIVHNLEEAKIAISVASSLDCMVVLRSSPEAAAYLGPQVFHEIIKQAKIGYEETKVHAVFDCGNDSGTALCALRYGIKAIRINVPIKTLKKISDIAKQMQASVEFVHSKNITDLTTVLDLLDQDDPESAVRSWLIGN